MLSGFSYKRFDDIFSREIEIIVNDVDMTDVYCEFTIEKSLDIKPNTLDLQIYNLNSDTRSKLQQLNDLESSSGVPVVINVGYKKSGIDQIWKGNLRKCTSDYDYPNWVTSLSSGDSERATQLANINQSWGYNTPVKTVINALVKSINEVIGAEKLSNVDAQKLIDGATLNGGGTTLSSSLTLSGNSVKQLELFAKSCGLEFSIQDNAIQILNVRGNLISNVALVSPFTGMIGRPDSDEKNNIKLKHLIIPGFKCGGLISVDSKSVSGLYRIEKLKYNGSSMDPQKWTIDIEASQAVGEYNVKF